MLSAAQIQTIRDADPNAVLPGIDTMTGNPYALSTLLDVTKITQNSKAPFYYSPSTNAVYVTQSMNIATYLALGDGGDRMSAFDPAKDVIDLSRIDADILTAGVQNFSFIGSAPCSGGAQVRYQLDPTNDDTIVQAALAGDITA